MEKNKRNYQEEFETLLRSTGREGIDDVIDYLHEIGFFKAPASATHHLAQAGGLVRHSVNTCQAALAIWEAMSKVESSLPYTVKRESIIIAALLHDVCKSDSYEKCLKKRKNNIGVYEDYEGYKPVSGELPIGHGEKSLVMLLYNTGLTLTNDEMLAIRWHMGPWRLNFNSMEEMRLFDDANNKPLVPIIYAADLMAARIMELES